MIKGTDLEKAREAKGLSREELAKKCKLASITIYSWEHETSKPRPGISSRKYCDMLEIPYDKFFCKKSTVPLNPMKEEE